MFFERKKVLIDSLIIDISITGHFKTIISDVIHYIKIPLGHVFTSTKLNVSLNHQSFGGVSSCQMKQNLNCLAINQHCVWKKKWQGFKSKEHHPKCEARGWQHHVWMMFCWKRDWRRKEDDTEILKQDIRQNVKNLVTAGSSGRTVILNKPPKLEPDGSKTWKWKYCSDYHKALSWKGMSEWGDP